MNRMKISDSKQYNILKSLGIFRSKEAQKVANVSWTTLSRWVTDGYIKRVARGLYIHPKSPIKPEELDFAMTCTHFGTKAVIGGLSALFYYGLIDQAPQQIWVIIPSSSKDQSSIGRFKCLRTTTTLNYGINEKKYFKITNIERTLIESLKFSSKIGLRIVIKATRLALEENLTTLTQLGQMADKLKMNKVLEKYWESIVV